MHLFGLELNNSTAFILVWITTAGGGLLLVGGLVAWVMMIAFSADGTGTAMPWVVRAGEVSLGVILLYLLGIWVLYFTGHYGWVFAGSLPSLLFGGLIVVSFVIGIIRGIVQLVLGLIRKRA